MVLRWCSRCGNNNPITMNKIIDFSKGINNKADAEFIGDGFVVEAKNVEYNNSPSPTKRKGIAEFDLALTTALSGMTVKDFWIWYPPILPKDAEKDYLVVAYGSVDDNHELWVLKYIEDSWSPTLIDISKVIYTAYSSPVAYIGDKFIIVDGINRGHYIEVDKDKNLVYDILGLDSPITKMEVSPAYANNHYVSTTATEEDTGMTIERGNILLLCYTVEDKYGNESNPSPLTVYTDLQYRYPEDTDDASFQYWWASAKYSNMTIPEGLNTVVKDTLEKFNVYRADVRYTEGTAESVVFKKVATIDIASLDEETTLVDSNISGTATPSYEQDIAPIAKLITENSKIKFVANLNLKLKFPFHFSYYNIIKLTNNNGKTYINAPIAIQLDESIFGDFYSGWGGFTESDDWKNHIRFYDRDRITPLPVVYVGDVFYVLIPFLTENSVRNIYLTYDKRVEGGWENLPVSDTWQTPEYGQFINAEVPTEWTHQKVFYPNRVRNENSLICCSNEYHGETTVPNRADNGNRGKILNGGWTTEDTYPKMIIRNTPLVLPTANNVVFFDDHDKAAIDFDPVTDGNTNVCYSGVFFLIFNNIEESSISGYEPDGNDKNTINFYPIFSHYKNTKDDYNDSTRTYGWTFGIIKVSEHDYRFVFHWGNGEEAGDNFHSSFGAQAKYFFIPTEQSRSSRFRISLKIDFDNKKLALRVDDLNHLVNVINQEGVSWGGESVYAKTSAGQHRIGDLELDHTNYLYYDQDLDGNPEYIRMFFRGSHIRKVSWLECSLDTGIHEEYLQLMNFSPIFAPNEHLGYKDNTNRNLVIEDAEENISIEHQNLLKWSTVNGMNFPDLWERSFKEPIKGIIPLRKESELSADNRLLVFGRNILNIFYLSGHPDSWADSTNNIIEDFTQFGLLAENSLGKLGSMIFWFSEIGAIMFDGQTPTPISMNKIDIPIKDNYIGFAIPLRNQYVFHDNETNTSYVYHLLRDAWTTFEGLNISKNRVLTGGDQADNLNLFLNAAGRVNKYPTDTPITEEVKIKTRKYVLDNNILRRFRVDFESENEVVVETEVENRSTTKVQVFENVARMEFRGLQNGTWGEYMQFTLTDWDKLKKIEHEIQRR